MRRCLPGLIFTALLVAALPALCRAGQLEDGIAAFDNCDYATAAPLLEPYVDGDDPNVWFAWGVMLFQGEVMERDAEAGHALMEQAANAGFVQANLQLGWIYSHGTDDVPYDCEKALYWYQTPAEHGDPEVQNRLGELYSGDRMLSMFPHREVCQVADHDKAIYWFERSANQGNIHSMVSLASLYYNADGPWKDLVKAHVWYSLSHGVKDWFGYWNADAIKELETRMTEEEIARAEGIAAEWVARREGE